ncbi:MAG: L-histidine N(alpha)-methyltransferase [Candidatus Geothermincolia bacterium]
MEEITERRGYGHAGAEAGLPFPFADRRPGTDRFLAEVVEGLGKPRKELPSKYFYDATGARLFEEICTLDEYYVPRTEASILRENLGEMAELVGERVLLVDFGCGDCAKVRILLEALRRPAGFVPVDISFEQLCRVSLDLRDEYPGLEVLPVCADYTLDLHLPEPQKRASRKIIFFPGSTLGNFDPLPARLFLNKMGSLAGEGGGLLVGVDLMKDPAVLHAAYNDRRGITAAFNMNLLKRINRELGADFDLRDWRHYAFFNPAETRVEMHLVSLTDQVAKIGDRSFRFMEGESIWTESSYKYTRAQLQTMAASAGLRIARTWTDPSRWFSLLYLVAAE